MDIHGATVGKANLRPGMAITEMAWNCERFNMEEQPETQNNLSIFPSTSNAQPRQPQPYLRPDGKSQSWLLLLLLRILKLFKLILCKLHITYTASLFLF